MYRRYGNRTAYREISKRALWIRVVMYTALLVFVLVAQDYLGKSAGNCFALFDGTR